MCTGFQGGTTMPENTTKLMRQVYIYFDHKNMSKIPFL